MRERREAKRHPHVLKTRRGISFLILLSSALFPLFFIVFLSEKERKRLNNGDFVSKFPTIIIIAIIINECICAPFVHHPSSFPLVSLAILIAIERHHHHHRPSPKDCRNFFSRSERMWKWAPVFSLVCLRLPMISYRFWQRKKFTHSVQLSASRYSSGSIGQQFTQNTIPHYRWFPPLIFWKP